MTDVKGYIIGIWILDTILAFMISFIALYWMICYIKISKCKESCKHRRQIIVVDICAIIAIYAMIGYKIFNIIDIFYGESFAIHISKFVTTQTLLISLVIGILKYTQHTWKLYYETQFSKIADQRRLSEFLDNSIQSNWYIDNKHKWGNSKYLNRVMSGLILLYVFVWSITWILHLVLEHLGYIKITKILEIIAILWVIPLLIPIIYLPVLYSRFKSFKDAFLVIEQFKYNARIALTAVILWVIFRPLSIVFGLEFNLLNTFIHIGTVTLAIIIPCFTVIMVDTYWVIKNVIQSNAAKLSIYVSVDDMFSSIDNINSMLHQLCEEFSVEVLLSYIEFRQYEQYVINQLGINNSDEVKRIFPHVPISHIITKHDKNKDLSYKMKCKYIAYDLYNKYIKDGSKYQINISFLPRKSLDILLQNKQLWLDINITDEELFQLYAECALQMRQFLRDSVVRQQRT